MNQPGVITIRHLYIPINICLLSRLIGLVPFIINIEMTQKMTTTKLHLSPRSLHYRSYPTSLPPKGKTSVSIQPNCPYNKRAHATDLPIS